MNNFIQENLCKSNSFLTLLLHWVAGCGGISGYLLHNHTFYISSVYESWL